jgi:hypothetical protein
LANRPKASRHAFLFVRVGFVVVGFFVAFVCVFFRVGFVGFVFNVFDLGVFVDGHSFAFLVFVVACPDLRGLTGGMTWRDDFVRGEGFGRFFSGFFFRVDVMAPLVKLGRYDGNRYPLPLRQSLKMVFRSLHRFGKVGNPARCGD